jgi:hypothetical protein
MERRHWGMVGVVLGAMCLACSGSSPTGMGGLQGSTPVLDAGQPAPDAGTSPQDGGPVVDPCAGLRPKPPGAPVSVATDDPLLAAYLIALQPISDGEGNVLLAIEGHFTTLELSVRSPDGGVLGTSASYGNIDIPLPSGFAGVRTNPVQPEPDLTFDVWMLQPDGGNRSTPKEPGIAIEARDPRAGLAVLGLRTKTLTDYDGTLDVRWRTPLPLSDAPDPSLTTVGVDVGGNALVLYWKGNEDAGVAGIWVDASGDASAPFDAAPSNHFFTYALVPAVEGGLFLRQTDCSGETCILRWIARFAPLSTVPEPVPAWLLARPNSGIGFIHGHSAYAVGGTSLALCTLEVVAADGTSCGVADFSAQLAGDGHGASRLSAPNAGSGALCSASLDVGLDGTVTSVRRGTGSDCAPVTNTCRAFWDWFPAYFR